MSTINLLVTTPLSFSLAPADPANPTEQEKAISAKLDALGARWEKAGQSSTKALWRVITRSTVLQDVQDAIAAFGLPITILAAQNAHPTQKVDVNGKPVMDVDNNPVYEVVVYDWTSKSTLLKYMPDVVKYDDKGNVISKTPATEVTLPVWGGHTDWCLWR